MRGGHFMVFMVALCPRIIQDVCFFLFSLPYSTLLCVCVCMCLCFSVLSQWCRGPDLSMLERLNHLVWMKESRVCVSGKFLWPQAMGNAKCNRGTPPPTPRPPVLWRAIPWKIVGKFLILRREWLGNHSYLNIEVHAILWGTPPITITITPTPCAVLLPREDDS